MTLEGQIRIRLSWDGRQVCGVRIAPRSLAPIRALLRSKQPAEAVRMLPMIFSLCGQAQAAAAAAALQAAGATNAGCTAPSLSLERCVLLEALQELLWRLLLDLPTLMQGSPAMDSFARLRRALTECKAEVAEAAWQEKIRALERAVGDALLGPSAPGLNVVADRRALTSFLGTAGTPTAGYLLACMYDELTVTRCAVQLLPALDSKQVLEELLPSRHNDAGFSSLPYWRGRPAETGSLARMQHHPLVAGILMESGPNTALRLVARLLEIGDLFSRLRAPDLPGDSVVQGAPCGPDSGVAWVQNARGLLLHRVSLDKDGAIADYCLVAPTEWNFHPEGSCVAGLTGMPAASESEARRKAQLLIHSLDPCVAYKIEVDHA